MTPSPSPPSPYLSDPLVNSLKFMKVFLWGGPKMGAVHVHTFGFKSLSSITPPPPSLLMQFPPTSSQVTSRGIPSQLKPKEFLLLSFADLYLALREDCSAEDHW